MMKMTSAQAQALADLVHELRPGWGVPGIMGALRTARDTITPDAWLLAQAAIAAAANDRNITPAVIGLPGPHWPATAPHTARSPRCPVVGHTSYLADNCGACITDALIDDAALQLAVEARQAPRHDPIAAAGADLVRAALSTPVRNPVEEP